MTSSDVVRSGLADYFRMIQAELHELVEPISTDQLWQKPYSYGNSIGNLVLHLLAGALPDSDHGNHCSHADDHSQHCQAGAQLVAGERPDRDA